MDGDNSNKKREKRIEELEKAVEFYKSIADHTYDWEIFIDSKGKMLYTNNAFERITGYLAEDVLSGRITEKDIIHMDDLEFVRPAIDEAISRKIVEDLNFRIVRKDGGIRYVNLLAVPVFKNEGFVGTRASIRDITLQKNFSDLQIMKENAESAKRQFQDFFNNAPDAIFIIEEDTGLIVNSNQAASRLLQLPIEEIVGHHQSAFQPSYSREVLRQHISESSRSVPYEDTLHRTDGTKIPVGLTVGEVTFEGKQCLVETFRDITHRKEKEEELNVAMKKLTHSHKLMQYIIEHQWSGIVVLNKNLEHVYVSQKFLDDTKVKEKRIIGKHHYEVFPDLPASWKEVHQRTLAGEVLSADNDQFVFEDGSVDWVRWESRPWYEADCTIGGIILYTEVITKQKKAEMDLTKAKERAEESDRLKTAFLQNMSHEVRTPLNSIVGFSDLISDPGKTPSELKTYSKIISDSSDKLIRIITDVIEISKIQAKQTKLSLTEFDVVQLVTGVINDFRESAERKNISLSLKQNIPAQDSMICSDHGKLEKILIHLTDNAIKFTHKGAVEVLCEIRQDNIVVTISDTGIGISKQLQNIIFEPFHQLETRITMDYGGNGLGLAIVRAYTELLKGTITLKSEEDKGTTFTLSIPVNIQSGEDIEKHDKETDFAGFESKVNTILIAEDEYGNYRYLYEVLLAENFNILHANNGREAVEMCKNSDQITLILMDIKMPVMNGITAARAIKEFRPDLPIIAQTAYAGESLKLNNIDVFDDLIAKPINRNELKKKMKRYINY
jgi:PAS domain S-box-containing protein